MRYTCISKTKAHPIKKKKKYEDVGNWSPLPTMSNKNGN